MSAIKFIGTCGNGRLQTVEKALLLSPSRAADYLGIGRTKLLGLAKAKKIKTKRIDDRTFFVRASLVEYAESLTDRPSR